MPHPLLLLIPRSINGLATPEPTMRAYQRMSHLIK